MCMNAGNVRTLRNHPKIDKMLDMQSKPMKAPLFLAGANHAKERHQEYWKEELRSTVNLGFVAEDFNKLP